MTVYYPSDEEIARWKEASAPTIDAWLAESGDLGRQLLDAAEQF
jgi:C4-dicarboxylate-binding protein DctP